MKPTTHHITGHRHRRHGFCGAQAPMEKKMGVLRIHQPQPFGGAAGQLFGGWQEAFRGEQLVGASGEGAERGQEVAERGWGLGRRDHQEK